MVDGAAVTLTWVAAVAVRVWLGARSAATDWFAPFDVGPHLWLAVLVLSAYLLVFRLRGAYRERASAAWSGAELVVSIGLAMGVVMAGLFVLDVEWVSRPVLLGHGLLCLATVSGARAAHARLLRRRPPNHRVVLLGPAADRWALGQRAQARSEWAWEVVAERDDAVGIGAVLAESGAAEVVVVGAAPRPEDLAAVARACDELGVRLSLDANFLGLRVGRAELRDLDGFGVVSFSPTRARGAELVVKRVVDVVGASLLLVLTAPLLAMIALAVWAQDRQSPLYVQRRAGLYGRPFPMLKVRTMVPGADAMQAGLAVRNEVDGPGFKLRDDPRITPLGRWLRRSSLDELPQLLNVLRGDMSLVGPRPPLPDEVSRYEPWQLRRLSMRPGITGLWQVSGRSSLPFDRWMALDLAYIDGWSLWLDVRLLLRTVPAVLSGRGAW